MTARSCASFNFLRAFFFLLAFLLAVLKRLSVELKDVEGEVIVEHSVLVVAVGASLSSFSSTTAEKSITEHFRTEDRKTVSHPNLFLSQ